MTTIELSAPANVSPRLRDLTAPLSPLDLTDERLMEMIQNREEKGLGLLHDRYASTLKALIMRVIHNDAESDDMLQEIFVEIWNRAGAFDASKGKPLGWIVTMTRRRAIDRLRKRESYDRMGERLLLETQRQPNDFHTHVEEDTFHHEMREHLAPVLAALPEAQRRVIELTYYQGYSQREIAALTGIPLGTIKTRIELGMKKIALALKGMEDLL